MIATSLRKVNVRAETNTSSKKLSFLESGQTIKVKAIKVGEEYRGSNLWIEDTNGNNQWLEAFRLTTKNNLSQLLDFKKIWTLQNVEILKIGLIDTGVLQDNSLFGNRVIQINHRNNDITDVHGTYMASIIASSDYANGYAGVIPNLKVYSYRASWWDDNLPESEFVKDFIQGLTSMLELGVDVVNISMGTYKYKSWFESDARLKGILKKFIDNNIPILAATGNDSYKTDDIKFFPAGIPSLLSVSGYSLINNTVSFDNSLNLWSDTQVLSPSFQIFDAEFFNKYNTNKAVGSSVACAVASACVAAMKLLFLKSKNTGSFIDFVKSLIKAMPVVSVLEGTLNKTEFKYLDFNLITDKII